MPQLRCMAYRPQNRAQIYDFFPINKETSRFYRLFRAIFLEMSKQFVIFVGFITGFEMFGRDNCLIYLVFTLCCLGASLPLAAQNPDEQVRRLLQAGDSLRLSYRFQGSKDAYEDALEMVADTALSMQDTLLYYELQDKVLMAENGLSMTGFVDAPSVLARRKFSIEDFFLHYPLQDSCWRAVPNQLDSAAGHAYAKATFIKDDDRTVFWSAEDDAGARNIYVSSLCDSLWSLPALINEQMTSASDEIYPMLSPDGKSLFFSSKGLYGVGGYDIYVSHWNEDSKDWDAPVNLGFPYSSPADDFLYVDTEDGRYSIFASNRDCPSDSVWVYVLEFDNIPVRRAVEDPAELAKLAELDPVSSVDSGVSIVSENGQLKDYKNQMRIVMALKDSVSAAMAVAAEGGDASSLSRLKEELTRAQGNLQQVEMELLMNGVVVDPEKMMSEATSSPVVREHGFSFEKRSFGKELDFNMEVPQVKFDYSFKVLEQAQFAEDQTIPKGIVYQIQMFATKRKASLKSLKGLSPVYEVPGANGHKVYRVGLFRTYSDVLANLNTVKKLGFRSAFIVAFVDGKSVTVAKARAKEKEKPQVQELYEVRIVPAGGELDSGVAAGVRQQAPGKDIARSVGADGAVTYVVGPFADKAKAEELALFVKAMGVKEAFLRVINK